MAKAVAARTKHIRRVASAGDLGWRLCEQFHAVQWGPVAFLVVAVLATVAAVSWIAALRRQTVIGGASPGHLSYCDCSIFLKCRFATPTIVSTLGGGMPA
jgi:hypothetical protein